MPWLQVKVSTDPAHATAVEEALSAAGALSVTFEDAGDAPILEPAAGEMPLWSATRVVALFTAEVPRESVTAALSALGDEAAPAPVFESLPDREWTRAWLDDWRPLRFGHRLWVAPLEADVREPGAVVVRLDPGLAFGTGTHATTALCLEWLEGLELAGARVLDLGCGSGILAIAALRLGARAAHAVDLDPQALEATRANAARNDVGAHLTTGDIEQLGSGPYDVIVANILAGPLLQAAATLAKLQAPGARLALAGILAEQADEVIAAYGRWYTPAVGATREGWVRIDGERR